MSAACTHLDQIRDVVPRTPGGCEECLATGGWWEHKRQSSPGSSERTIGWPWTSCSSDGDLVV